METAAIAVFCVVCLGMILGGLSFDEAWTAIHALAGNLFIVGGIANIIVVDAAQRRGVAIG